MTLVAFLAIRMRQIKYALPEFFRKKLTNARRQVIAETKAENSSTYSADSDENILNSLVIQIADSTPRMLA